MHGVQLYRIGAAGPPALPVAAPPERLVKAANEFEAQMLKELLKPLQALGSADGGGEADGEDGALGGGPLTGSTSSLEDFATEALGEALARQGGFGIASGVVKQLGRRQDMSRSAPVTE